MAWPDYSYDLFENFEDSSLESGLSLLDDGDAITIPSNVQYHIGSYSMALNLDGLASEAHLRYGALGDNASFGFWFRSGSYGNWAGGPQIVNLRSNSLGNLLQMYDARHWGSNDRIITAEGNSVAISDYTWYWITIQYNRDDTGYWRVYDTSGELVGAEQEWDCPDYQVDELLLGSWAGSHATVIYFDGLVLDYTEVNFPLLGWESSGGHPAASRFRGINRNNNVRYA